MGQCEHPDENDQRRLEGVRGARPGVQAVGDFVEMFLAVDAQVRAIGQVLAQQAVRVLAGAALPRPVRVTEVHRDARSSRQILVACEFLGRNERSIHMLACSLANPQPLMALK